MKKRTFNSLMTTVIVTTIISCSSLEKAFAHDQPNDGPPTVDEVFAKFDANKDDKLSVDEVKGPLAKDFSKIDTNSDGFITKEELTNAPKPKGKGPNQGPPKESK